MKLGAYTACLHDKPIAEALGSSPTWGWTVLRSTPAVSCRRAAPPDRAIRESKDAREEYLGLFAAAGVTLTALNCNGNPLHPDPEVRDKHSQDVLDAIEIGALLGVKRVVTMSGLPGTDSGGRLPAWTVQPWDSSYLDARDYQWNEVAIPFWKDIQARASDADVKVCIEMHPHNIVYNPATMERLATEINATHVGAEMDPSHLFWQGIDPVAAIGKLGSLVYNAAAKDTRINAAAKINGVLDDRFTRVPLDDAGRHFPRRALHPEPLARELLLGLRRGRARPRCRILGRVPRRALQGGSGHGRQHRARGSGARPAGGPAPGRRNPPRGGPEALSALRRQAKSKCSEDATGASLEQCAAHIVTHIEQSTAPLSTVGKGCRASSTRIGSC